MHRVNLQIKSLSTGHICIYFLLQENTFLVHGRIMNTCMATQGRPYLTSGLSYFFYLFIFLLHLKVPIFQFLHHCFFFFLGGFSICLRSDLAF